MASNYNTIYKTIKSELNSRLDSSFSKYAKLDLLERIKKDIDNFVPYDTGALSRSASVSLDGNYITYDVDYASYVYNMPEAPATNFTTTHHPYATSFWDNYAYKMFKDDWEKGVIAALKRGGFD